MYEVNIVNYRNLPTRPNRTQYIAANIVKGIDANRAPNLPVIIFKVIFHVVIHFYEEFKLISLYFSPNIAKNIIKPADI